MIIDHESSGRKRAPREIRVMQQTSLAERMVRRKPLPSRPVLRETVQDRVYRQIKEMILSGDIEPGQTVTIQGLSDAFRVSPMPVREALRRLMAEQALMVVSGRSVGIPALTRARLEDLRRVRREIEGMATGWAAERIGAGDMKRLAELIERMQTAADARDGRRYVPANRDFHFTIYRVAGSPVLLSVIETLWLQIGPYFHVLRASDNWHAANRAHRDIWHALRQRDGTAASDALRRDIDEATATLDALLD
jgi:DNA-binding GntR family transcriptional regulator